jgi:hypothetical protein
MDRNRVGPPVRVSVRTFLEWVPGPGRYRKPVQAVGIPSNRRFQGATLGVGRLRQLLFGLVK